MNKFLIRKATVNDLPKMLNIYADARQFMKDNGNESQWGLPSPGKELWPSEKSIIDKINKSFQYVCEVEQEGEYKIAATFAFTNGIEEPSYASIFEGKWPDVGSESYGVIHCFASSGIAKGAASYCINWALNICKYMKIDTHPNNKPMRNLLDKLGFNYCGKILMPEVQNDDILRVAYWKRK